MRTIMLCALAAVTLGGCATTYTSIERNGDKSYLLTRVRQGFFTVSGSLHQCTAESDAKMKCTLIAQP
jgi:hypothetical protein